MKRLLVSANIGLIVLLLSACGGGSKTSSVSLNEEIIPLKYAENLLMMKGEDYTRVQLRNPWDTTSILSTYILIDKDSDMPPASFAPMLLCPHAKHL